ncbi:beta-galactosidase-1-like protein 2 [Saccoglossus kowalevskii]
MQAEGKQFSLNGRPFQILSGAVHYFRVHPDYWKDRLLKLKACGLNTVETYVPWNAHEEVKGQFDFTGILDLVRYIKLAQEVGLFVIFRPGPYICSEWDFGGLPSWLLHSPDMRVRTTDPNFLSAVDRYFDELLPLVEPLQFSNGGPIIAIQVENEYGSYGSDLNYMIYIKETMEKQGMKELFLTSDGNTEERYMNGRIPDVLMTANFQIKPEKNFGFVQSIQGENKPLMTMEYWSGWFDHWGEQHHVLSTEEMEKVLVKVLDIGASVNFYMFHGGTNFGFWNGANLEYDGTYLPTVTSYDYDAPLSESGEMTEKYFKIKEILKKHALPGMVPANLPVIPKIAGKINGQLKVEMTHFLPFNEILDMIEPVQSSDVVQMEMLPINMDQGQGYGYILYKATIDGKSKELTFQHPVKDRAQIFVNGKEIAVITATQNKPVQLKNLQVDSKENSLDILVENQGRVNYGKEIGSERKGLHGDVKIDGVKVTPWRIYPLEFKNTYMAKVRASSKWQIISNVAKYDGPMIYKGTYTPPGKQDAFIDMQGWTKGVLFVNNLSQLVIWTDLSQLVIWTGLSQLVIWTDLSQLVIWTGLSQLVIWTDLSQLVIWTDLSQLVIWTGLSQLVISTDLSQLIIWTGLSQLVIWTDLSQLIIWTDLSQLIIWTGLSQLVIWTGLSQLVIWTDLSQLIIWTDLSQLVIWTDLSQLVI